jgi:hypothetical protein
LFLFCSQTAGGLIRYGVDVPSAEGSTTLRMECVGDAKTMC